MTRQTALDIRNMKGKEKITMLTAYDYGLAKIMDEAKIDMILVGDSMGMVVYGQKNTLSVTLEMEIMHCKAVSAGVKTHSLVIGDMPFLSCGQSIEKTVKNAGRIVKEGKAHAVKLEGASDTRIQEIEAIIDIGIPVQGHIGLLPQSSEKIGGYKVQGKKNSFWSEKEIIESAQKLEEAGCFSIVLEAIPYKAAAKVTESINIPTIGIGAGKHCDGQVLVCYDMLDYIPGRKPKFVKTFSSLHEIITDAVQEYSEEIKRGLFPTKEYSYED